MRELCKNEVTMVSGSGILADDPYYKQLMDDFDSSCTEFSKVFPYLNPGVEFVNKVVHGTADIVDKGVTALFDIIKHPLG